MSDDQIKYCPWCGGPSSVQMVQDGHKMYRAAKCSECETAFRVTVPIRETSVKWSDAY